MVSTQPLFKDIYSSNLDPFHHKNRGNATPPPSRLRRAAAVGARTSASKTQPFFGAAITGEGSVGLDHPQDIPKVVIGSTPHLLHKMKIGYFFETEPQPLENL